MTTEWLHGSLDDLGNLKVSLGFLSEDDLSSGLTNVVAELLPVARVVLDDGVINLTDDVLSVNQKVLANCVGKGGRRAEDSSHSGELFPVSLEGRAVGHALLDDAEDYTNLFDTGDDVLNVFLLEVLDGDLGVLDNCSNVLDAVFNIIEAFSVESALEDTFNNLDHLLSVSGLLGRSIGQKECDASNLFISVFVNKL